MTWLDDLLGGGADPNKAAQQYMSQIPGMEHDIYDPYISQGQGAYGVMSPQFQSMSQDPSAFINQLMGQYEPSKGYQLQRDEALRAAGNTAAAGGMRGSMQDIEGESGLAARLQGQDMQQWLNNVLGVQSQGLQGEQGLYGTGFQASGALGGDLANVLGQQAQYAYQGAQGENQKRAALMQALGQLGGSAVSAGMGGFGGFGGGSSPYGAGADLGSSAFM